MARTTLRRDHARVQSPASDVTLRRESSPAPCLPPRCESLSAGPRRAWPLLVPRRGRSCAALRGGWHPQCRRDSTGASAVAGDRPARDDLRSAGGLKRSMARTPGDDDDDETTRSCRERGRGRVRVRGRFRERRRARRQRWRTLCGGSRASGTRAQGPSGWRRRVYRPSSPRRARRHAKTIRRVEPPQKPRGLTVDHVGALYATAKELRLDRRDAAPSSPRCS